MIKVNELFAGIGAFRKALINLDIPHEIVGISEIDKFAIQSYEAMYGPTRNYGDISKIARLDYADDGVNLLSVNELQKYTLIKIFNFSIILLSFLCHVKIL